MEAVEKALVLDARIVMIGHHLIALPKFFDTMRADLKEDRSRAVTSRDEDQVACNKRSGRVHRGMIPRTPVFAVTDSAGTRVQQHDAFAGEEDNLTFAVECGGDRRRIARLVVRSPPYFLARIFIEGNDAGSLAANIHHQQIALHE